MNYPILFSAALIALSALLLILALNLMKKSYNKRELSSTFECGFTSSFENLIPFSLYFLSVAIAFLIFDVEISLLFPLYATMYLPTFSWYLSFLIVLLILMLGVIFEWSSGSLMWEG